MSHTILTRLCDLSLSLKFEIINVASFISNLANMALAYGHCVTFLKSSDFLCLPNWSLVWNTFKYYPSSKFGKLQSYWLGVLPLFQSQVILKWWVINPCKTIPECYGVSRTIFTLNLVHNGLNYIELFRFQKPTDLKTIAPSVLTKLVLIVDDLLFKFSEDTAVLVNKELLQIWKQRDLTIRASSVRAIFRAADVVHIMSTKFGDIELHHIVSWLCVS